MSFKILVRILEECQCCPILIIEDEKQLEDTYGPGMLQGLKIWGGHVVMRRAATARRRLLICQNRVGQLPPLPLPLVHPCLEVLRLAL